MNTAATSIHTEADSPRCIFERTQLLKFDMNREECIQMIKSVLKELNAHMKEFGDKILCILREGCSTYAFELNIESKPTFSAIRVENFRVINSFSEVVEWKFQLRAKSYQ